MQIENGSSQNKDILSVDGQFEQLVDINFINNYIMYRFFYKIDYVKALEKKSSTVRISIYENQPVGETPIFLTGKAKFENIDGFGDIGRVENEPLITSILLHNSRCKDKILYNAFSPAVFIISDFTNKVSNENAVSIAIGKGAQIAEGLTKRTLTTANAQKLSNNNQQVPVLEYPKKQETEIKPLTLRTASISLALRGKEPFAFISKEKSDRISTNASITGVSQLTRLSQKKEVEEKTMSALLQGTTNQKISTSNNLGNVEIPVVQKVQQKEISKHELVRIPSQIMGNGEFFVKFDLLNSKEQILQTIIKRVNHSINFDKFITPKIPPKLEITTNDLTRNIIYLEQLDPIADKIKLYKKQICITSPCPLDDTYELVKDFPIKKGSFVAIFKDANNNSIPTIYRAIAFYKDKPGANFSSQMISMKKGKNDEIASKVNASSINTEIVRSGILLDIRNLPDNAINVRLVRKDITKNETKFTTSDEKHDSKIENKLQISFLDKFVKNGHTYEYKAIFTYIDGCQCESSRTAIQEYIPLSEGTIDLKTTPPISKFGDVKFKIGSVFDKRVLEAVKDKLIEQGIKQDIYDDVLKNEREGLGNIATHKITRHNLLTGEKEDLGTFTGDEFSDKELSAKSGAKPIANNASYKYIISTQTRETETLFEKFKKNATDATTGKTYSYNPLKFQNPLSLRHGTIFNKDALKIQPKDAFELGNAGNKAVVVIEPSISLPEIVSANAQNIGFVSGRNMNQIKWSVSGDKTKIDHFIVSLKRLGQVYLIGRANNVSQNNLFEFLDPLDFGEVGQFIYLITPIFNDFNKGKEFQTNEIFI